MSIATLETPREGVALITLTHPKINNHGSWEAIDQLAARLKEAREAGARFDAGETPRDVYGGPRG